MGTWRASPTLSVHNIFLMQPMQVISSTIPTNTTITMGKLSIVCIVAALVGVVLSDTGLNLFNAAKRGDIAGVKAALAVPGVDLNYQNPSHSMFTPLGIASARHNVPVVTALLNAGADINMVNTNRNSTALHLASSPGSLAVVKVLVAHHADLTLTARGAGGDGWTALHFAAGPAGWNSKAIAQVLLQAGINKDALDSHGRTASDVARKYRNTDIANMIDSYVAPPTSK